MYWYYAETTSRKYIEVGNSINLVFTTKHTKCKARAKRKTKEWGEVCISRDQNSHSVEHKTAIAEDNERTMREQMETFNYWYLNGGLCKLCKYFCPIAAKFFTQCKIFTMV